MADKNLSGKVLLAAPALTEPTFHQTVIFLADHSKTDGAAGIIVNRPTEHRVRDVLSKGIWQEELTKEIADLRVHFGGPVSPDYLSFLAIAPCVDVESDEERAFKTHLSLAEASHLSKEGFHLIPSVGYAGWSAGQLEGELAQSAWVVQDFQEALLQEPRSAELWKALIGQESPWHRLISDEPDQLGLN